MSVDDEDAAFARLRAAKPEPSARDNPLMAGYRRAMNPRDLDDGLEIPPPPWVRGAVAFIVIAVVMVSLAGAMVALGKPTGRGIGGEPAVLDGGR